MRNILEKLQLRIRMEAAMYAVREKLVDARLRPAPEPPIEAGDRSPAGHRR